MALSVLMVCTGNICRSPAAELLMRARVDDDEVVVASAGTAGLPGHELDLATALALRELGVDPASTAQHVARRLRADLVAGADLVLCASGDHRAEVLLLEPLSLHKVFTLREFARLAAAVPTGGGQDSRGRVALVAARRGLVDPAPPGADDIADPFGAGLPVARVTAAAVSDAVDAVIASLGLPRRR